ncbi:MAG TPA: hypothetical protein VJ010_06570, partial [Actinomycetota bacterium]|nr:hypothetical protein [Actinomycetota bacterium]
MSRTFETDGFQADLAAQRNPAQFVGPLSHAVSLRAPSGLAHGLATAVQTTTHTMQSPEMPLGPPARQGFAWRTILGLGAGRRARPTVSRFAVADAPGSDAPPPPTAMPGGVVPAESAPAPPQLLAPALSSPPVPAVRERPSAGPPEASLTTARTTAVPAMVLPVVAQRTVAAAPDADEVVAEYPPETVGPATDSPAVETLGIADEPMTQVSQEADRPHSVESAAPDPAGTPEADPMEPVRTLRLPEEAPTVGFTASTPLPTSGLPPRRLGLGAPLAEPPPSALKASGSPSGSTTAQRSLATPPISPPRPAPAPRPAG